MKTKPTILFMLSALVCLSAFPTFAQKAMLRRYDVADGLANSIVMSIYQDKKGFIWISTQEGLSRFDGYGFVSYGVREGLGHQLVNDATEDKQGRLWVATNGGGVSLLIDRQTDLPSGLNIKANEKFVSFRVGNNDYANQVNQLLFDRHNDLWCLTDFGLYRASLKDIANLKFEPIIEKRLSSSPRTLIEDSRGRLWLGLDNELFEINDGQVINHGSSGEGAAASGGSPGERGDCIRGIVESKNGKLLISTYIAVYEFIAKAETGGGEWLKLPLALDGRKINLMIEDSGGSLWISVFSGTDNGIIKYQNGQQKFYAKAQGIEYGISAFAEDREGNLWFGTHGGGVYKFGGGAFVGYTKDFSPLIALDIFETGEGKTLAVLNDFSQVEITESQIRPLRKVEYAPSISRYSYLKTANREWIWGSGWYEIKINQPVILLRNGQKVSLKKFFTDADFSRGVHYYEDENGVLWLVKGDEIYRADAGGQTLSDYATLPKNSLLNGSRPQILSDRVGGLWLSSSEGLCRMREKQFHCFQPREGLSAMDPRALFVDSRGWLWVGLRYHGVSVTKTPQNEQPQFINYLDELPSNTVWFITEDNFGRMYFGTDKGLAQFDIEKNLWRYFNSKNGLNSGRIGVLTADHQGNIWICTAAGLTKFNPRLERRENKPPPIYLSRVNIAGEVLPMAETGAEAIPLIELQPSRNNLTIEFVGLDFSGEDHLSYQYKLEGIDADWSPPTKQRFVNYGRLAADNYRFLVRAINPEGTPSITPAAFEFRILSPIWQRWWFLTLAAVVIGLAAYSFYRYRLTQRLAVERVRTRIAADLHDDIGSSLSQITVLSEVLRKQLGTPEAAVAKNLSLINRVSQEALDSMSDIVWAINPRQDHLSDLVRKMRRVASDILPARNIEFNFNAPIAGHDLKLGADIRRQVFLMFKEMINNMVRHAHCTRAEIELKVEGPWLALAITDNGKGFDPDKVSEGNGLVSLHRRARSLGGQTRVSSQQGSGTTVSVVIPHRHHFRLRNSDRKPPGNGSLPEA